MPDVGETLKGYRIVARLQSGGMGTLFRATRVGAAGFTRDVAIKVVHPHLAEDPRFVALFVREALVVGGIRHPSVVHVEEFGQDADAYFLVMEYVDGPSLWHLLRSMARRAQRMQFEVAVAIAMQVAEGLHAAHESRDEHGRLIGVVHRDVSPHNVLLARTGQVKVIDFGVAIARFDGGATRSGVVRGKPGYLAPEQARGRPLDRRADVYALGIVLWEMLTMERLFKASDEFGLLELAREPDIAPPGSVVPGLPPALDRVVMKALSIDPDGRYPTTREFRQALAEAMPSARGMDAPALEDFLREVGTDGDPDAAIATAAPALQTQGGSALPAAGSPLPTHHDATRGTLTSLTAPTPDRDRMAPRTNASTVARRRARRLALLGVLAVAGVVATAVPWLHARESAGRHALLAMPQQAVPSPAASRVIPVPAATRSLVALPASAPSAVPRAAEHEPAPSAVAPATTHVRSAAHSRHRRRAHATEALSHIQGTPMIENVGP